MPQSVPILIADEGLVNDRKLGTGTKRSQVCYRCETGFVYTRKLRLAACWYLVGECAHCQTLQFREAAGLEVIALSRDEQAFPAVREASKKSSLPTYLKNALLALRGKNGSGPAQA